MKTSDVVMTTSIELRNQVVKPTMRATMKSKPGTAMAFLYLGGVTPDEDPILRCKNVMEWMGWVLPPEDEGQDAGIEATFSAQQKELAK